MLFNFPGFPHFAIKISKTVHKRAIGYGIWMNERGQKFAQPAIGNF